MTLRCGMLICMPSPKRRPSSNVFKAIEIIAAALSAVAVISSWNVFDTPIKSYLLIVICLLGLTAIWRFGAIVDEPMKWANIVDHLIAAALFVCVGAFASLVLTDAEAVEAPVVTQTPNTVSASPDSESLRFVALPAGSVPECSIYNGTGTIPAGHKLVVFDRSVDSNHQPNGSPYYLNRNPADNNLDGRGWHTALVDAGDTYVEIVAVLMPEALFASFSSIVLTNAKDSPEASWLLNVLPPGIVVPSTFVQPKLRTAKDPSGCPE